MRMRVYLKMATSLTSDNIKKLKLAIISRDVRNVKRVLQTLEKSPQSSVAVNTPLDVDRTTFLHLAANTKGEIIDLLIQNGANVNQQNSDGYTSLHIAAINGCIEGVACLLANGADRDIADNELLTPQYYAEENGHCEIVALLDASTPNDTFEEPSMCQTYVNIVLDNTTFETNDTSVNEDIDVQRQVSKLCSTLNNQSITSTTTEIDQSDVSVEPSKDDIALLSNSQIRERLIHYGEQPGPVTDLTRKAYINYLKKIISGTQPSGDKGFKGFKYELALCLNGTIPVPVMNESEDDIFIEFRGAGHNKSYFNYFLMDPKYLQPTVNFKEFVESIFYVGKGKSGRPFQHLKDAKNTITKGLNICPKVRRILDIWDKGEGVISLHVFNGISASEAYCREASMIEAIGLDILTNLVKGHYHGKISSWSVSHQRLLGVYLLHKSFKSFKIHKPQPFYFQDL